MPAPRVIECGRGARAPAKFMWVEQGFLLADLSALVAGAGGRLLGTPEDLMVEFPDGATWGVVIYSPLPRIRFFH